LAPFSYIRDARTLTPNLESHQHFKYIKFKRVIDFYRKLFDNIPVPKGISKKFAVFSAPKNTLLNCSYMKVTLRIHRR